MRENENFAGLMDLYPYMKLSAERIIFFSEDVTKDSAHQISSLLLYYDHINNDEITIYINSRGGDVSALSHIYDVIQMIKSPVKTIVIGKAYSAGALLLACGSNGRRGAFKHSCVMIHGIQCAFPIAGHDAVNSKNYLEFLDKNNDGLMKILAEHTGQPLEKIKMDCLRDMFISAEEALEYGLIDFIL